jgi:hypothetical protein
LQSCRCADVMCRCDVVQRMQRWCRCGAAVMQRRCRQTAEVHRHRCIGADRVQGVEQEQRWGCLVVKRFKGGEVEQRLRGGEVQGVGCGYRCRKNADVEVQMCRFAEVEQMCRDAEMV